MALNDWYNNQNNGWYEERFSENANMLYSVYIPPNGCDSNTKVYVFSCNPHDYGTGWLKYVKNKQAEHPDAVFLVVPSIQDGTSGIVADTFANRLIDITNEYNIPTTNIDMFSWSNGNKGTSAIASSLNGKGYTIGRFVSVFGNFDGSNSSNFFSNFETGKSSSFPYIYINDGSNHTNYDSFRNNCNDYIVIDVPNSDNHSFWTADRENNLIDFFLADEDFKKSVKITRYVNGQAQTMTYEEFEKLVNQASIEALKEQYSELSDFAKYFNGGPGDTLGSNLAYVSNAMSSIKGKITEHQDINYTKASDNEASIIGAMYGATNYYGTVTNLLYGNLSAEADAVYTIANAIYKMDGCASQIAESSLTDGMSSLYDTGGLSSEIAALEKASNDLYETSKSAAMASGRYDELANVLGTKATAGSVGKISISSLEGAINAIVPSLNSEIEKATSLKSSVTDFMSNIGASKVLQGGVWEDVAKNMQNYSNLLDANVASANFISEAVETAMGIVTDYIQNAGDEISAVGALADYGGLATAGELDDTKLPELTAALTEMQEKIEAQEQLIKEKEALPDVCDTCTKEDGTEYNCNCRRPYTAEEMQEWKDALEQYKQIKQTLDSYKTVLEGLAPVVQAAQGIIEQAITDVKNMYETPTQNSDNNIEFNTNFELDLSPYSDYIDTTKDYKGLINDYYDKLNPKATIDDVLALDAAEADPAGTQDDSGYDGGYGGGYDPGTGYPSGPTTSISEAPTDPIRTTEPATEKETEVSTEKETEPGTEKETVPSTETKTEASTEVSTSTQTTTEPSTETPSVDKKPGGTSKKPSGGTSKKPNTETKPQETEIIDTQKELPTEAPVYEEPVIEDDYFENEIPTEITVDEIIPDEEIANNQTKGKGMKTLGIAAGIGLAVGASALGAHAIMKNKEEDEDDYDDYGYEK